MKIIKIEIILILLFSFSYSQSDLMNNLGKILSSNNSGAYTEDYVKGYMQPFVTAFGTSVSGGLFHRATVKQFPRFDAGISGVIIQFPNESFKFSDINGNQVSSIFGPKEIPEHDDRLPGGTDIKSIFIPQFHINLGLVSSFEVTARYMKLNISELGDINLMGLGVKYGFGEFIPVYPIDLSAQAMYHKFSIGDWLDSGTIGMSLQMSKNLNIIPLELYGGIGFDNTTMLLKTDLIPLDSFDSIGDISIDGENNYRFNLGLSWTFEFVNFHADYNFGRYDSISFGAMLVF